MNRPTIPILTLSLVTYLLVSPSTHSSGVDPDDRFKQACEAYSRNAFAEAEALFLQLAQEAPSDPALPFNLGNTYYRLGDPAKAVLWYHRALRLDPGDPDIHTNLRIAREDLGLISPEEEREAASRSNPWTVTRDWLLRHRLSLWRNLALAGYWAVSLLLLLHVTLRRRSAAWSVPRWLIGWAGAWTLGATAAWGIGAMAQAGPPRAVVLAFQPPARYAPLADSAVRFELRTGEIVEILDQADGWYKIQRPGERESAFLPKSDAEPIVAE